MCKRILKYELQLSSYWQNIKLSWYCPKFLIFTINVIFHVCCNFLHQLLHPYKFYGRDMSGILFFIFASCEWLISFRDTSSLRFCKKITYVWTRTITGRPLFSPFANWAQDLDTRSVQVTRVSHAGSGRALRSCSLRTGSWWDGVKCVINILFWLIKNTESYYIFHSFAKFRKLILRKLCLLAHRIKTGDSRTVLCRTGFCRNSAKLSQRCD